MAEGALNTSVNQENRRKRRRKEDSKRRDIKRKRVMIPTMKMKLEKYTTVMYAIVDMALAARQTSKNTLSCMRKEKTIDAHIQAAMAFFKIKIN